MGRTTAYDTMAGMPVRPITITGEPVLHRRADVVSDFGPDLQELIDDMLQTQSAAHGVGLAAPQVGVGLRVFTWHLANGDGVVSKSIRSNCC